MISKSRVSVAAALAAVVIGLALAAAFASQATSAQAEVSDEHAMLVRKLLEVSGTGDLAKTMFDETMKSFREAMPHISAEFWDEFQQEAGSEEFIHLLIPIYAKHFSPDELKELIALYETPIGRKLVQRQPQLMRDSMEAGQRWGEEMGMKVLRKLQEGPSGGQR